MSVSDDKSCERSSGFLDRWLKYWWLKSFERGQHTTRSPSGIPIAKFSDRYFHNEFIKRNFGSSNHFKWDCRPFLLSIFAFMIISQTNKLSWNATEIKDKKLSPSGTTFKNS